MTTTHRYRWALPGDLNAFFALFLDNLVNLVILATILSKGFGMPAEFVYTKMIPGTALGVMFGDLVYTWLAFRLARKTGRDEITAMPLGLDTPSTIGVAVAVLGPAYAMLSPTMGPDAAAHTTWYIGMGVMLWMGLVKVGAAFIGEYIQKVVPVAALLGSLAGIGLVWLAAHHMVEVYKLPFVGIISLGIVLFTMIAHFHLPGRLPGAAAAVILGSAFYYILAAAGYMEAIHMKFEAPSLAGVGFLPPLPQAGAFAELFGRAAGYLPVAIPFGILTIIGGINVTEGARQAGDDYKTRDILLTEAIATIVAGMCGGVSQSTPYIGHSAYKKMGARAAYTLATGLAVGLGAMFGLVGFLVQAIPQAAVAPILVFVGFEIVVLAFRVSPGRHNMAVCFAIFPAVLNYAVIQIGQVLGPATRTIGALQAAIAKTGDQAAMAVAASATHFLPPDFAEGLPILFALGSSSGYVLTAMIWGALAAFVIDRRFVAGMLTTATAAVLTLFGFIHSVLPSGGIYLPWALKMEPGMAERGLRLPFEFATVYILLGLLLYAVYRFGPARLETGPSAAHEEAPPRPPHVA